MATRIVNGTRSTFVVDSGSDVTYQGAGPGIDLSANTRAFRVNPANTGDITIDLIRSTGVSRMQIFQEDNYGAGNPPSGLLKDFNVSKAGKGKGKIGVTVTDATKDYLVYIYSDSYSSMSYDAIVEVP